MSRLGIVTRRFQPAEGGIERFLAALCAELSRDYELRVLTQSLSNEPPRPGIDDIFASRCVAGKNAPYPLETLSPSLVDRARLFPCVFRLFPVFRRFFYESMRDMAINAFERVYRGRAAAFLGNSDIVHSFAFGGPGLVALYAARRAGAAFVITPFLHEGRWGDSASDIRLYNAADAVVALHEADASTLRRLGVRPELVKVCGVGVPPINGNAGRFRTRFALPGKMALFVGRLERHKGYQELVKAVSRLPEKSMHLILMGPHSSESLAFAETVGASNVRFLGHVPEQEKQDAISACDILCLPSDSEVMPVVVLEAWLSGKPVLTGDIPAIRSFVTDGETGVLVRRDAAAIERALRSFLREPSSWQAMGLKGKRVVETRYRIDQVAFALRDIYDHAHKTRKEDTRGVPS